MAESKKPTKKKIKAPPKKKTASKSVKDTIKETIVMKIDQEDKVSTTQEAPKVIEDNQYEWDEMESEPRPKRGKKASSKDVTFFLRQMAILLSAGVPLMRALKILTNRSRNADFRMALLDVMQSVEKGSQLYAAMAKHSKYFNTMLVNVIRTGEESGNLPSALSYQANYRDRESEMFRSVEKAVTYPMFLLILAIGLVFVLITMVIPVFAKQFAAANVPLPWPTRVVFGLSESLTNVWIILVFLAVAGYIIYKKVDFSKGVGSLKDKMLLKAPIFGKILINIYTVQFSTMMSLLLKSGLPLIKALDLVQATMTNSLYKRAFRKVRMNVERGRTFHESLAAVKVFPPIVLDMLAVGEEAGLMPEVLDHIAESYQKEVDYDTAVIGTLLEPIMIVSLGVVVGFIAIAMFMPYFRLAGIVAG